MKNIDFGTMLSEQLCYVSTFILTCCILRTHYRQSKKKNSTNSRYPSMYYPRRVNKNLLILLFFYLYLVRSQLFSFIVFHSMFQVSILLCNILPIEILRKYKTTSRIIIIIITSSFTINNTRHTVDRKQIIVI